MVVRRWGLFGVTLCLCGLAALHLLTGCSPKKTLIPNLTPETSLFVRGPVDTVNHVVRLYWVGNDSDGDVVGFELRFKNPAAPSDTDWVFTTKTDSTFTVFTPSGFSAPRLEIRAVDNENARDPSPAIVDFSFTNRPPSVTIIGAPRPPTRPDGSGGDSTYASATLEWRTVDPDGDLNRVTYRVWMIGSEDKTKIVSGRTYTIPSADFLDASGQLQPGLRSAVIQPIDDGGLVGTSDTTTWYVRAPSATSSTHGRLLIVDDCPALRDGNAATDQIFADAATRNLPPGSWSVLRLQFNRSFRSSRDLEQTLALFDAVIWYRGDPIHNDEVPLATGPSALRDYQDGIGAYLEAGGNILLEGLYLFRNTEVSGVSIGYLRPDLVSRYFGSDGLVEHGPKGGQFESATVWGTNTNPPTVLRSAMYGDSLRFVAARSGLFCFAVRDTHDVAFWARVGQLSQGNTEDLPVGVSVAQPSGGRAVVLALPIRVVNGYASVPRILDKIFASMGLTP